MTDKQIIIDKLKNDVACKENIINHLAENNIKLREQLTHKEQECERWKKANDEKNELLTKLGCPTMATAKRKVFCLQQQLDKLKAENEQLKEELSVIQHNCNREGCKYYDDDTFKVFYECKAQKALQLSANSVTTKYCDLLKALIEIKAICNNNDELQGDFNVVDCDKYKLGKHNLANKIIQKISEVTENENS